MASTRRVALLLDGSRGWDAGILRGVASYANRHRAWQFLRPATTYYQRFSGLPEISLEALLKNRPSGAIMHECELSDSLASKGVPTITVPVTAMDPSGHYITCDDQGIGETAAKHLMGQGLKHFGYLGFAEVRWSQLRLDAFQAALDEQQHRALQHLVPLNPKDAERSRLHKALIRWIKQLPKPIGVFACNDDLARAVAEGCHLHGIDIPEEVALLGVDNDELICELSSPPLSSIPLATERAGYEAAEMLDCLMDNRTPETNYCEAVPMQVVVRQSTDRLMIEDPEVLKAVRFIRGNASRMILVGDVVDATELSQRTLHNRFKAALGHSIIKEINLQRAEYIAGLLTDTSQSIGEIAWKLGYHDDAHLVRFFRREMGLTPGAYRRRQT